MLNLQCGSSILMWNSYSVACYLSAWCQSFSRCQMALTPLMYTWAVQDLWYFPATTFSAQINTLHSAVILVYKPHPQLGLIYSTFWSIKQFMCTLLMEGLASRWARKREPTLIWYYKLSYDCSKLTIVSGCWRKSLRDIWVILLKYSDPNVRIARISFFGYFIISSYLSLPTLPPVFLMDR